MANTRRMACFRLKFRINQRTLEKGEHIERSIEEALEAAIASGS